MGSLTTLMFQDCIFLLIEEDRRRLCWQGDNALHLLILEFWSIDSTIARNQHFKITNFHLRTFLHTHIIAH